MIKKGEERIEFLESKLGLAKLYDDFSSAANDLTCVYESIKNRNELSKEAEAVKRAIEIISKGNQDVPESY